MLETLEKPIHSAEKNIVLKAISDSSGKISVAEIVTKTSLPVLQASSLLNQIAYETGGHLSVGTAGSVVYEFDRNFQSAYLTRGSRSFFKRMGRIILNASTAMLRFLALAMFFLIRISFGILMIVGIVVVITLIVVVVIGLLAKMFSNSDNDSGGFDFDFGPFIYGTFRIFRYWAFDWLWDWWFWGRYIRWDPAPSSYKQMPQQNSASSAALKQNKENFLDKCFSFLFGDGDPNKDLNEKQWHTIALVLKAKQGTVIAEELAPYVAGTQKNEDWVLPILVRFNGTCEVSEEGTIIYSFPSFQQKFGSASGLIARQSNQTPDADLHTEFQNLIKRKQESERISLDSKNLDSYFKESLWQFSHLDDSSRTQIIGFAALIMIGGIWLTNAIFTVPILIAFAPVLLPLLYAIAAYGAMFLIVPGIRYFLIQHFNKGIESRNAKRFEAAQKLQSPEQELRLRLDAARQVRQAASMESEQEETAYSTDKDLLEQEFDDKQ